MDWLEKMNNALDYIEANLADEISYDKAAHIACCSTYHFQRIFSFIVNVPLTEYIRHRRLAAAADELKTSSIKVIDVAAKYGYESPEAFSRAFKNFHGVMPKTARDEGVSLRAYPRITFQKSIKGDSKMSAVITKVYKQEVPALRFIGKKYGDKDRVDGMFGKYWGDWFENNWFTEIEKQTDKDLKTLYEDAEAYIGLMRWKDGEPFEYWIGIFMPENTSVPNGFIHHDFEKATLGVCWVHGQESEVFMQEDKCGKILSECGHNVIQDKENALWFFERYGCPRFTSPDENGKIILDICHYIK